MNSRSYRSMSLISIEGKSLEQTVKRKVGEHLQKEVKMHSGKTIIPHSGGFLWQCEWLGR